MVGNEDQPHARPESARELTFSIPAQLVEVAWNTVEVIERRRSHERCEAALSNFQLSFPHLRCPSRSVAQAFSSFRFDQEIRIRAPWRLLTPWVISYSIGSQVASANAPQLFPPLPLEGPPLAVGGISFASKTSLERSKRSRMRPRQHGNR